MPLTEASSAGQGVLDTRYVKKSGDTMTGALIITPSSDSTSVLKVTNAANSTNVLAVDTVSNFVGIGKTPFVALDVLTTGATVMQLESNNTTSAGFTLTNSSTNGHSFGFFSTGQTNNPGHFGVFDNTTNKTVFDINGTLGDMGLISGAVFGWSSNSSYANAGFDTGLSRLSSNHLVLGNGTASDESGTLYLNTVGMAYGSYIQVDHASSWPSGTHKLIGVTWNGAADQTDIFTPGSVRSTSMLSLTGDAKLSFFNHSVAAQGTSGADLTNNVTLGGSSDVIADFTNLTVYATDAPTIRNDIYQLARKLKQVNDALRAYGLLS